MMELRVGSRAAAPFFCFKSALETSTRSPVEGGGGEPGEPLKQMKKEKGPFQKKETATLAAPSKNFKKNKKGLLYQWKTPKFRVLSIRQ